MHGLNIKLARGLNLYLCVYKNRDGLVRAWKNHDVDCYTGDTSDEMEAWTVSLSRGVNRVVVASFYEGCPGIISHVTHEAHHAADYIWSVLRKRKAYRNIVPSEFRAYMTVDIVQLFKNWRRAGWNADATTTKGMTLPDVTLDWDGIKRARKHD